MKKTQFIELLSLIRHSIVPFLSIVLFVTMSITLFAGMTWTVGAFEEHVDDALDQANAYDFSVTSKLGLTDSDLDEIGKVEGVTAVEAGYISYQTIREDDVQRYCMVNSVPDQVGTLTVVEGELPQQEGEIALLQNSTKFCDYQVGDTITFDADGTVAASGEGEPANEGMKYLTKRTYTITALVASPNYLCTSLASLGANADGKQITCVFYVPEGSFVKDAFEGSYPVAYVAADSLDAYGTFDDDYETASDAVYDPIVEIGETLSENRYNSLKDDAQKKIDDAQSELDAAQKKIDDGQKNITTGEKHVEFMKSELAEAQERLESISADLTEQRARVQQRVDDLEAQIADAEAQIADAKAQIADATKKHDDGQQELDDAKADVDALTSAGWIVLDRNDSYLSEMVATSAQTLGSLRLTMASLFIVVGLLVCYSVMARLVHEDLTRLGTKKALGFSLFEIARQYLGYALLACVLGIVLGAAVGGPVVELVLFPQMNQYALSDPGVFYQLTDIILVSLVEVVLICLSAWLACRSILEKNATELLAGVKPSRGKHRFYEGLPFWNRLGLLTRTMINNCFNDRRRVVGTLIGVAGCTSLIVCAVTLQGGISNTLSVQENVIERYDQVVYVSQDQSEADESSGGSAASTTVDQVIASKGYTSLQAMYSMQRVDLPDGAQTPVTLIVPEDADKLSDVMTIQMTQGGSIFSRSGVYISCALADSNHYEIGDVISFEGYDGYLVNVPVAGVFSYYGGTHIAIMSEEAYSRYYLKDPVYSARLVNTNGDTEAFSSLVSQASDFDGITDSRDTTRKISESVTGLALTVVAIYLGISALVALFVLLNLNIMFISEKKRELIVLMINGYEMKDAKRYVSRDTIIMDALGMLVGCLLGTAMGVLAIWSLQNSRLVFIAAASPFAWVVGIVVCAIFSVIVMRIALRKVNRFRLTSVNE